MPTPVSHVFNKDPKAKTTKNVLAIPDSTLFAPGDGTVVASSAAFPGFKWLHEHHNKNKKQEFSNSKPVKLVEYCSHYKNEKPIYDTLSTSGIGTMQFSEFLGRSCSCLERGLQAEDCRHSCIASDEYFAQFVMELALNYHTA